MKNPFFSPSVNRGRYRKERFAAVSALETAGITVLELEEGEQRVTLLVKRDDEDAALCAVHDALVPR